MMETGDFNLLHVLSCTFLWSTLYFILCLRDSKRSYEWHCRMATVVHASIISLLALYGVFVLGPCPWTEAGGVNTPHQVRTITLCLGYFLFDFSWCLWHQTEGAVMLTHHTLSVVGMSWSLIAGKYGTELVATIAGAEVTNPLLQLRWFMKETGNYNTVWGDVVDGAFMLSFGFFRIYMGSVLLYRYYQQPTDLVGRAGGTFIYAIGWAFFISIVQYAIHKFSKRYQERQRRQQSSMSRSSKSSVSDIDGSDNGVLSSNSDSTGCSGGKLSNGVMQEREIPTQREIKYKDRELTVRKNCVVKES